MSLVWESVFSLLFAKFLLHQGDTDCHANAAALARNDRFFFMALLYLMPIINIYSTIGKVRRNIIKFQKKREVKFNELLRQL